MADWYGGCINIILVRMVGIMKERKIAVIHSKSPTLKRISQKEWDEIAAQVIPAGEWHFERCEPRGVKPVKGKFDPTNPAHIKVEDVITIKRF